MDRSKLKKIAWFACMVCVVLLFVALFLPFAGYKELTPSIFQMGEIPGVSEFRIVFIIFTILVMPWAFFPQRWAGVVGILTTIIYLVFVFIVISAFKQVSNGTIKFGFGAILMIIMAVLNIIFCIVKIAAGGKKKAEAEA